MKSRYFVYLPLLILSSLLLSGCTKNDSNYDTSNVKEVDSIGEVENSKSKDTNNESDEDLGYLSNPQDFTKDNKSVGSDGVGKYKVAGLTDSSMSGYHTVVFRISKIEDSENWPLVQAQQVLDRGVIRVTLSNISEDESGIAYQQSRSIDKGAIGGIYHAVTSKENTAIYEIGISSGNTFNLTSTDSGDGEWLVTLDVAYDLKYSAPDMDYGSTEFSSDEQEITGIVSSDGAKISSYSYSVSGGVLRFVFSVASGTSNPIPSVSSSYDDMNILNVSFNSLESDKVSSWSNEIALPAGIKVKVLRSGESSVYSFNGIGKKAEYKLSASKSPNQVIVEIKL